jgi:hypothetical protein
MAPKGIKTSKLSGRKSRAKVVEWKTREISRGTRYFPVEIGTSKSRQTVGMDIVDPEAVLPVPRDADPQSMDVDEPLWIDEDVPEQTRVSSPSCPFLMSFDWLLVPAYLHRRFYS